MKLKLIILLVLLTMAGTAYGQGQQATAGPFSKAGNLYVCPVPSGGTPCPSPSSIFADAGLTQPLSNPISVPAQVVITFYIAAGQYTLEMPASGVQQVISVGGSGGGSGPSVSCNGATAGPGDKFFQTFWGYAPQDCGAKGDSVWLGDCGMATNNHVTCPTSTPFKSTDCQTGVGCAGGTNKYFEITSSASLPITVISGTITAFNSSSDVTVSQTAGSTFTNQRFRYGTDDSAALQAWVNLMIASLSSTGVRGQVRGGYIPRGIYLTKQPLRFVLPTAVGTGECGPNGGVGGSASGIGFPCNLWIIGDGFFSSQIWVATAGVFNWNCATNGNTAALYFTGAAGLQQASINLSQVGVLSDGSAQNTSGCTNGEVAALMFDGTTHDNVSGMLVQDFHNTTGTMHGIEVNCGFESYYQQSAFEGSDKNAVLNSNNGSGSACSAITNESPGSIGKLVFDTDFLEAPGALGTTAAGENLLIGTGGSLTFTGFQLRFRNIHAAQYGVGGLQLAGIDINGIITPANDHIEFDGCRVNDGGAGDVGSIVLNGTQSMTVEFHGCDITTSNTNAINSVDSSATARFFGGSISGAVVNAGTIIFTQVLPSGALGGAGTTNFNAVGVAFASLPSVAGNGSTIGCTNCTTASNPCTGASTGAIAVRQNGAWVCK